MHPIIEAMEESERLIIVPDVHGRDFWRETIAKYPGEEYIFLGDYLDPYGDEGITDAEAFGGLEDIIRFKKEHPDKVTLLWGNHDLHYLYPELMGSRYDFDHAERNAHLLWDHQTLFQMAYETTAGGKRFLFSHAGIGMQWILNSFPALLDQAITAELLNDLTGYPPFMSALEDISIYRGGDKAYGSMVWADVHEHIEQKNQIPGFVQVFGHTQLNGPVTFFGRFYCLDCRRSFALEKESGRIYDLSSGDLVTT